MSVQIGTVLEGKYKIIDQIGKGGMSTVYLAMDTRLNKQWAVKEISRTGFGKNNEEIVNEVPPDAEMMKKLDHPAIPTIVDIIDRKENNFIYVVMDYVEGESLDKVIDEYGAQSQELVIEWAKQICDAFSYIHSQKPPIIYRDMKPANIMLKPDGNIKIIDFGIAREYKEQNSADTTALGTRGYASPEHFGGRTDARSDIFTLGMTMHHLLTGVDPRSPEYEYAPIRQWNPELSDGLERIIDKCVSPDRKDRYQNCNELLYALDHYKEDERAFRKIQRKKLLTFIIAISLTVIFAISGLVTNNMSVQTEKQNYESLIKLDPNLDYDTAYSNIDAATNIDKTRIDAYDNFLEYISMDRNIQQNELEGMISILKKVDSETDSKDAELTDDVAHLYFKVGIDVFCFYEFKGVDNDTPISERAKKAITYFDKVGNGNYDDSPIAIHLYNICKFYQINDGRNVEKRDYEAEYKALFEAINQSIEYFDKNYNDEKSDYVKVAMYKAIIDYVHTDILNIAKYGKISQDDVMNLFDSITKKVDAIEVAENDEDVFYLMTKAVIDKIPEYENKITITYTNLNR